jgi:hypothetical protein
MCMIQSNVLYCLFVLSYQYISQEAQHRILSVVFIMNTVGKIRKHHYYDRVSGVILFVLLQYFLQSVVLLASGGWRQSRNLTFLF